MDDTLSRLSGRKKGTDWLFQGQYVGIGRLVFGHAYSVTSNWQTWSEIAADEHLFQGRHYLADHAQYDFRNRWQDSELGGFVTRDPIRIWADGERVCVCRK